MWYGCAVILQIIILKDDNILHCSYLKTIFLVVLYVCFCLVASKISLALPWQPPTSDITCIMFSQNMYIIYLIEIKTSTKLKNRIFTLQMWNCPYLFINLTANSFTKYTEASHAMLLVIILNHPASWDLQPFLYNTINGNIQPTRRFSKNYSYTIHCIWVAL